MLLVVLMSGCSIFAPTHKVSTFDLGIPKSIAPTGIRLYIMPLMNNTETEYQMLYRMGEYQVEKDPYNRWLNTPGALVTSYLRNAFKYAGSNSETDYTLSGEVTLFEINLENKSTTLSVNYQILYKNKYIQEKETSFKHSFDKASPDIFAKTMAKTVADFATELRTELIKLSKDT